MVTNWPKKTRAKRETTRTIKVQKRRRKLKKVQKKKRSMKKKTVRKKKKNQTKKTMSQAVLATERDQVKGITKVFDL